MILVTADKAIILYFFNILRINSIEYTDSRLNLSPSENNIPKTSAFTPIGIVMDKGRLTPPGNSGKLLPHDNRHLVNRSFHLPVGCHVTRPVTGGGT